MNWDKLVEERDAWIEHNFPDRTIPDPGESVMGVIEEVGELAHAILKKGQDIRGPASKHESAMIDAVGDITVYLLGVMSFSGERPGELLSATMPSTIFTLSYYAGHLALAYEEYADEATAAAGYGTLAQLIVFHLAEFCKDKGWDYEDIVNTTWISVRHRDWIKYPENGLPPLEQ